MAGMRFSIFLQRRKKTIMDEMRNILLSIILDKIETLSTDQIILLNQYLDSLEYKEGKDNEDEN